MSERVEFLTGLLSRRLGRELTEDEIALLRDDMTRNEAHALARTLEAEPPKPEPKKKSSWSKPKMETTLEEDIEVVVNEVESGTNEGTA